MKKLITAIVSLVLASFMAFGLVACNNGGGNNNGGDNGGNNGGNNNQTGEEIAETLQNAIEATLALPNYTVTESMQGSMSVKYNGGAIDEDAELGTISMGEMSLPLTGAMLLMMFDMAEGDVSLSYDEPRTSKYDFANGKIAEYDAYYDYETGEMVEYIRYAEVEGTTINLYRKQMGYSDHNVYNTKTEYVGYADTETAKKVLQTSYKTYYGNVSHLIFDVEYNGTGENSEREGTVLELLDLFTAEADGKTYSAKLKSPNEMPFELELKFTVEDGKMTGFNTNMDDEIDLIEYIESMGGEEGISIALNNETDKITVGAEMVGGIEISAIGSTSIGSIPEEDKVVDENDVYTQRVLSDKAQYEKMFADRISDEGSVSLSMNKREYDYDTHTSENTFVTVTVNEQLNIAKVSETYKKYVDGDKVEDTISTKLYWATDDGMKIYTAEYNAGNYFDGWSEEVITEAISGNKSAAILEKLPAEMQVYFNLNGKPMAEQFDRLEITNYTALTTYVTVNGEDVPVTINYNYYLGKAEFYNYYYGNTSIDVSYYYLNNDPRLPEVDTTPVTEEQWEELVTPWLNINNVTIKTGDGTTLIDIAEDGNSGKIYFLGNYSTSIYAEFAPSTEEEGQLTMTVYTSYNYWNSETEMNETNWNKRQFTTDTLDDLLVLADLWRYYYPVQRLSSPNYGSSYNKTIAEIYDEVAYDAMLQTYTFGYYGLAFIDGTLIMKESGSISYTFMNNGTTVLGEIPEEALAAE